MCKIKNCLLTGCGRFGKNVALFRESRGIPNINHRNFEVAEVLSPAILHRISINLQEDAPQFVALAHQTL